MKISTLVAGALTILALHPNTAFGRDTIPPEFLNRGCTFYANENGQGNSARLNVNHDSGDGSRYEIVALTMSGYWNDNVSAMKCDRHCSAVLYEDWKRQGREIEIVDGQSGFVSFGGRSSNNLASSIAVFCAR